MERLSIEIPDTRETYALFSKTGYFQYIVSYVPSYSGDGEEMMFDPDTFMFGEPTEFGLLEMSESYVDFHKVKQELVHEFVALIGYTMGLSRHTQEPYHISELEAFIDHVYDENSPYYPTDDTTSEEETE